MANKGEERTECTKEKCCIAEGKSDDGGGEPKEESIAGSGKRGNMPKVSGDEMNMSVDRTHKCTEQTDTDRLKTQMDETQMDVDGTHKAAVQTVAGSPQMYADKSQPGMDSPQMHVDESQTTAISKHLSENITGPQFGDAKAQLSEEEMRSDAGEMRPSGEDMQPISTVEETQPSEEDLQPTSTVEDMRPSEEDMQSTSTVKETQPSEEDLQPTSTVEEMRPSEEDMQPTSNVEETQPSEEDMQSTSTVKETQPSEEDMQPSADKTQPSGEDMQPIPTEDKTQPAEEDLQPTEDETQSSGYPIQPVPKEPHPTDNTWEQSSTNDDRNGEEEQWPAGGETGSRPAGRRKSSKSRGKFVWAALITLGAAALVMLCMQIYFRVYVRGFDSNKIIQGVSIGRMDVSGLTAGQAGKKLETELSDRQKAVLTLKLDDGRRGEVLVKSLEITVKNQDSAIKEAVGYGKKGSALECYRIMKRAEKNENKKDFPLQYEIKKEDAPVVFKNALSMVMKFPQNAKVMQTESGVAVVDGTAGELPDVGKTTRSIEDFLTHKWDGRDAQVKAYASHQEPELKASDLKDINAVIGTFSTAYAREAYATAVNIESGTLHLNGAFLKPGEEFSANAAAKPYIVENGYINAASDKGDMLGAPMGGGISQVSSTLYMAALYAELDVTRRTPNPLPVPYIKPSMDAAIAEGKDDLRFKNNMKTPIYIEGLLSNGQITFNIYGKETRDPGRKLDFVSEATQQSKPQVKHFVATPDTAGSYYTLSQAHPAVTARLWEVIYKDGQEQKREIVNTSQYAAAKETIAVGTVSQDTTYSKRITAAIKTQDEAAILNAVGKGQP